MTLTNAVRICVIGIGNERRGDDAAGLLVARRLKARDLGSVAVLEQSGEPSAFLEAVAQTDAAILVDAMQSGDAPGKVRRFAAGDRPLPARQFPCSTHGMGAAEAVELARALGKLPAEVVVYGIEGGRFAPGGEVSPEVARAIEGTVRLVVREIQALLSGSRGKGNRNA